MPSYSNLPFSVEHFAKGSAARAGTMRTLHAEIKTPVFMPVGTHATVRAQNVDTLLGIGFKIILGNTYHLYLRPGPKVFTTFGGIHKFMQWPNAVLTDSGGFQIFSLPHTRVMTEEGAKFRSYLDGKTISFTPEVSIETQKAIGSDIMMALDQCIPSTADKDSARAAMELTNRWALRSLEARGESRQALFGIVQGALFEDLRRESAEALCAMPFDGYAIGGLAVGEGKEERESCAEYTAALLPSDRPRYLMGVGTPIDLLEAVHRGIDMFDCILPSALSWQGVAFTSKGKVNLRRGVYRESKEPLDTNCSCAICTKYSRAYLHHLIKTNEPLGAQLVGQHVFFFYADLMCKIREAIKSGQFLELYRALQPVLAADDLENPMTYPKVRDTSLPKLGNFEVVVSNSGYSIKANDSQEVMHSVIDPHAEACLLYVEQSKLEQRLTQESESSLVVWDVGLGAGFNAMAAIKCAENGSTKRALRLISFENNLDAFRLVTGAPKYFNHIRHPAAHLLLRDSRWESTKLRISWELLIGDYRERVDEAPLPDIIFWDPFSVKSDERLWGLKVWHQLKRKVGEHATILTTYSNSTAVRAGLLAAGFYVGRGVGTGPKSETTVALSKAARELYSEIPLLDTDWLSRWKRSHTRLPYGVENNHAAELEARILGHVQFSN